MAFDNSLYGYYELDPLYQDTVDYAPPISVNPSSAEGPGVDPEIEGGLEETKTCDCGKVGAGGSAEGKVDSAGIRYHGKVLEGLVKQSDARIRATTRGNPLDPFNVAQEILARESGKL